jgi:alanyl-tRNA synthetase
MLITDGVIPSNEGRGYVLRRIIRRAVRHLSLLGLKEVSFYKLVPAVFEALGEEYPDNASNAALAEKLLKLEEEKFRKTLDTGLSLINEELTRIKPGSKFPGEVAFKLYDTFGFPLDLTEVILREKKIELDSQGFDQAMEKQKELSKKGSCHKDICSKKTCITEISRSKETSTKENSNKVCSGYRSSKNSCKDNSYKSICSKEIYSQKISS